MPTSVKEAKKKRERKDKYMLKKIERKIVGEKRETEKSTTGNRGRMKEKTGGTRGQNEMLRSEMQKSTNACIQGKKARLRLLIGICWYSSIKPHYLQHLRVQSTDVHGAL